MFTGLIEHRHLIMQLVRRDIEAKYRGSLFGLLWSLFHPVVMLSVYTFVFSFIFKARWNTGSESTTEFALALFIGMIAHGVLAENINKAPALIVGNVNFVKKVVFPLDILPWACLGTTIFHAFISLLVWVTFFVVVNQNLNWTSVFLPVVLLPLLLFSVGLSWLFAALGVFLRDIGQITTILSTVLLFLSPIFYPLSRLPERFQGYMYMNPLTLIVEQARAVLMWGQVPNWQALGISFLVSLLVAWFGFVVFQKARVGFADVL